jgi:hypothetical protein
VTPAIALRPAAATDFAFCRRIDCETMRWIVDKLFGGWDEARQAGNFARKWRVEEVRDRRRVPRLGVGAERYINQPGPNRMPPRQQGRMYHPVSACFSGSP